MLNLWLVVLLGFVASARGNYNTCYSPKGFENQINDICVKNPNVFTPNGLGFGIINLPILPGLPITSLTNGVFVSVTVDTVSLSRDFTTLSINVSVAIACNEVKNLQLSVSVDLFVTWGTSLDGCLQAIAGDISIKIAIASGSIGVIPDLLGNLLFDVCRPLLKTHFGACFNGILGIFNANLQSGGALVSGILLNTFATGVTVIDGVLRVTYEVRDVAGAVTQFPGSALFPILQAGEVWGCSFNAAQIAFLWNYSPKIYQWKWPACLIQSDFSLDVPLGSHVSARLSLNDLSVKMDSNGIKISAVVNVAVTTESGNALLQLTATVEVSVNLTARDGRIGLNYVSVSTVVDWALAWQHNGCSCSNVLNSVVVDLNFSLDLAFRGFVGNFGSLFSPGIPQWYPVNYKPSGRCYNSQGGKAGYCILIY